MSNLAAAEERWRLTIDNAPVGIALVSLEGRFLRVNGALCRILGYESDELMQRTFQEITHPEDLDSDLALRQQLMDGAIPGYQMRKRYLRADGEILWVDLSVALVRNDTGEPLHFVSHVADLTQQLQFADRVDHFNRELSEQKARLERSNADLEAFAVVASHDLQAPLATIRGYLELLDNEYADELDARAKDWIDRAGQAAERMSLLVTSLLEFSRVTGSAVGARDHVCVPELVDQVRADLAGVILAAGAVVEVEGDPPTVLGHGDRIRQVLQNLVQNTIKYRAPDRPPQCVVAVEEREDDWLISVTDNAAGIAEADRELVFSMFSRTSGDGPGYGIGLAACRQIVERHGGRIWVEPNPEGGSRFRFTLPR